MSWLRLSIVGALLAIAVQVVVMAQLAQYQVQRGVQLRQAQANGMAYGVESAYNGADRSLHTASSIQDDAGAEPTYVLR